MTIVSQIFHIEFVSGDRNENDAKGHAKEH